MARILLHDQQYKIGGPAAVLNGIEESIIGQHHELIRLAQPGSCGFNLFKAFRFVRHYKKEISKYNADAIYICGLQYVGFLMTVAAKLSNVKKVVPSVHGSEWDTPEKTIRKFILKYILEPIEVRMADAVFTVCNAAQKRIKALKCAKPGHNFGVVYNTFPEAKYEDVKCGFIREEFGISDNKILVAVVGRVTERKGHQYIIEAIKAIQDDSFVFMIVGDGEYLKHYREECVEDISSGRVILTGARKDVNNILKDADIFLFATLNENHSIALLEAVNMKCAVICTNVGGNPEIIENDKSGLLIPDKDSTSIIDALNKLKDSSLRNKYCDQAKEQALIKFSVDATYGKLERILVN